MRWSVEAWIGREFCFTDEPRERIELLEEHSDRDETIPRFEDAARRESRQMGTTAHRFVIRSEQATRDNQCARQMHQ